MATLANQQRTILFIIVDHLNQDASLKGLWTLIYAPGLHTPTWIPIYPAMPEKNAGGIAELVSAFQLSQDLHPEPKFLETLSQTNLAWSGYLVLDSEAVVEALKFYNIPSHPHDAREWDRLSSIELQGQQAALTYQSDALQSLCNTATLQAANFDLLKLYSLWRKHTRANFDLYLAFTEWSGLLHPTETIHCRFPHIGSNQP